jgi:hypothetical protein
MSRIHHPLGAAPTENKIHAVVPVAPVVSTIAVSGDVDDSAAARLLRWCEARLHLLDVGQADIRHLVLDMSHARRATASAAAILDHARTESARRGVTIHLVGAALIMAMSSAETRRYLGRWSTFPTLDSAFAALELSAGDGKPPSRPVDPDAILLTAAPPQAHLG